MSYKSTSGAIGVETWKIWIVHSAKLDKAIYRVWRGAELWLTEQPRHDRTIGNFTFSLVRNDKVIGNWQWSKVVWIASCAILPSKSGFGSLQVQMIFIDGQLVSGWISYQFRQFRHESRVTVKNKLQGITCALSSNPQQNALAPFPTRHRGFSAGLFHDGFFAGASFLWQRKKNNSFSPVLID